MPISRKRSVRADGANSPAFSQFSDPKLLEKLADPNDPATFERSKPLPEPDNAARRARALHKAPAFAQHRDRAAAQRCTRRECARRRGAAVVAHWRMGDNSLLTIGSNLGPEAAEMPVHQGRLLFATSPGAAQAAHHGSSRALCHDCGSGSDMNETAIYALARHAGIAVEWNDFAGAPHTVSIESIRRILAALGLPCDTTDELSHSTQSLKRSSAPPLVTVTVGQPIELPGVTAPLGGRVQVVLEDGSAADLAARAGPRGTRLPGHRRRRLPFRYDRRSSHHTGGGARALRDDCRPRTA